MPEQNIPSFSAKKLDNGIHEYVWGNLSREAVDVWVDYNIALYETTSPDETLYFIHIAEVLKFPPISYVIRRARELQTRFPVQPNTRTVILLQSQMFGSFLNSLSSTLNREDKDQTKFFTLDERDQAIEWLLEASN